MSRLSEHVGRVLGDRYRIVAPIGAGASALVFLAEDVSLKRQVAVKLLHEGLTGDQRFLERFRSEAQTTASLNHQHLVAVHDWGFDEVPYLVTEYLAGGSLQSVIESGYRLSRSQTLLVGLEAARALEYAHRRGLIHRDIKPSNLLFDEDGRLRVADFGLARALAESSITEPLGSVVGSARYASPEQARGEQVDGKSDVYSLALVLIEAATGEVPFASDNMVSTLMGRIDTPIDVPQELGPLHAVLSRAGLVDPRERCSAAELASELLVQAEGLPRPEPIPLVGALHGIPFDPSPTDMGRRSTSSDAAGPSRGEHSAGDTTTDAPMLDAAPLDGRTLDGAPLAGVTLDGAAVDSLTLDGAAVDAAGDDADASDLLLPRQRLFFNPPDPTIDPADTAATPESPATSPGLLDDPAGAADGDGAPTQEVPIVQATRVAEQTPPADVSAEAGAMGIGAVDATDARAATTTMPAADRPTTALPQVDPEEQSAPPIPMSRRQQRRARRDAAAVEAQRVAESRDDQASVGWILAGFALVAALGVAVWMIWQGGEETDVAVPSLVGLDWDDVGPLVGGNGWEVVRLDGRADGTAPGEVIAQVPDAGTALPAGDEVRVTVSIGNSMVGIPIGLVGVTEREAEARLNGAGLVIGEITSVPHEEIATGSVVRVDEAEFELPRGAPVDLVVSDGPVPRVIPDGLVGLTVGEAEQRLRDLRLEPVSQAQYSYEIAENVVMQISPEPGVEVEVGTQVGLLVSRGPEPIEVPDVAGMDLADAVQALTDARLCVGRTDGRSEPDAQVLLTEPTGGAIVTDPDDCVRIVTSTISPDEEGDDAGDADAGDGTDGGDETAADG